MKLATTYHPANPNPVVQMGSWEEFGPTASLHTVEIPRVAYLLEPLHLTRAVSVAYAYKRRSSAGVTMTSLSKKFSSSFFLLYCYLTVFYLIKKYAFFNYC